MIVDVMHFSFTVTDIERSIAWYTSVLGLELVHRQRQDNPYTRTLLGFPDAVLEVAQFRVPGLMPAHSTHVLELVEYVQPRGRQVELPTNQVGVAHLAFVVNDIHKRHRRMEAEGVLFRNAPVAISEGANEGGWSCYFHDPDGITLELLQFSDERMRSLGLLPED
jgi:catechol 2,3-dioxygenase-like lactoylglutathione lyase family enzyme